MTATPNRRTFACFVIAVAAFTVYGSLVPFEFRARTIEDAWQSFIWAMDERAIFESRSDAAANVLLGVPLGFGVMALMFVDRRADRERQLLFGFLVLPGCVGFAALVEFAQLYVPLRTCAGSDVYCQGVGAALGMVVWLAWGQRLVVEARSYWTGTGSAGRVLLTYALLLTVIQTLPLDLNPSPKDVYKKLRDNVRYIPMSEFFGAPGGRNWEQAAKLAKVIGLYLPVGLLAARMPGKTGSVMSFRTLLGLAFGLAIGVEGLQLLVRSRVPTASDACAGAISVLAGFALGLYRQRGLGPGDLLGLGAWWLWLILIAWGPIPFVERVPHAAFDWLPGMALDSSNPLALIEDLLVKVILFGLGGVLLGCCDWLPRQHRLWTLAFLLGVAVAGVMESLQMVFGTHTPSVTDVLVGGLGSFLGAWFAEHLRNSGNNA